jgi:hypothetical protein
MSNEFSSLTLFLEAVQRDPTSFSLLRRSYREATLLPAASDTGTLNALEDYIELLDSQKDLIAQASNEAGGMMLRECLRIAPRLLHASSLDVEGAYGLMIRETSNSFSVRNIGKLPRARKLEIMDDLMEETRQFARLKSGQERLVETELSQYFAKDVPSFAPAPGPR